MAAQHEVHKEIKKRREVNDEIHEKQLLDKKDSKLELEIMKASGQKFKK